MIVTEADRQHRRVSALAFQLLAEGRVSAFDWACAHQESWTKPGLTPEQAMEISMRGYVAPDHEPHVSKRDREAHARFAKVLGQRAPWDVPEKKEQP